MTPQEQQLANVLREHLLPLFKLGRPELDPWWWPIGTGATWQEWFGPLQAAEVVSKTGRPETQICRSLRYGPLDDSPGSPRDVARYAHFQGFWGHAAIDGMILVVVSDRPSHRSYPKGTTTRFMGVLGRTGYHGVHVTDFIKRRCPKNLKEVPPESESHYADILVEELVAVAEGRPEPLLHIVPMWDRAMELIDTHKVLPKVHARLGKQVSRPAMAPIFPWNAPVVDADVDASWRGARAPHIVFGNSTRP